LPVGASQPVAVDIRVIAATHCPLETLVREGRFRDDLYYRLNGAHFQLPPLRERSDLDVVIDRLLDGMALDAQARALLRAHRWPGNLRELANALAYASSVCSGGVIHCADLPDALLAGAAALALPMPPSGRGRPTGHAPVEGAVDDEAEALRQALRSVHWNVSALARQWGCARMTLYRRMARLGVQSPNARDGNG